MTSAMALRCPKCSGDMATYERSGVTLDQCRECRGIFLDRGELERLVDAEGGAWLGPAESRIPSSQASGAYYRSEWHADDDDRARRGSSAHGRPSRKRSLLGELLEGFGD